MLRCFVPLIGLLVTSGCITKAGDPSLHPISEIMAPTFCLHGGKSEPLPITRIAVERGDKVNDERIEWQRIEWHGSGPPVWQGLWEGSDQLVWSLEYAPDGSDPPANTFSCITHGKVPPGYKEESPALPLTPERLYRVTIDREGAHAVTMYFIIRLDPMGRPVKLEYTPAYTNSLNVRVITR